MKLFGKKKEAKAAAQPQQGPKDEAAEAEATPQADVFTLPRASGRERRRSHSQNSRPAELPELPSLKATEPNGKELEVLFLQKLELCSVCFDFEDPSTGDKRGKDIKRATLLEMVEYVNPPSGHKIFTEPTYPAIMNMVKANICRSLPPQNEDFDPEEDEPVLEPAWPHLQVVYEFFLRFVVSQEVNAKNVKRYLDQPFCLQLIELFDSEDPRERDYLKTILHRIYGKFMSHRSMIRKTISNVFYRFIYETESHNGIGELLEILGSIINGFAMPLKKEHLNFLSRALIPLHVPKCMGMYHQQLSYCIVQYIEKEVDTSITIIKGLLRYWPWSSANKQVLIMNELEEILEMIGDAQVDAIKGVLFPHFRDCICSTHFQVTERALFLWNNDSLTQNGCLGSKYTAELLPLVYFGLKEHAEGHWNSTVQGLAEGVIKAYLDSDKALSDQCHAEYANYNRRKSARQQQHDELWAQIKAQAGED